MKKILLFLVGFALLSCKKTSSDLKTLQGNAIGTTFSIKYLDDENKNTDFEIKIDSIIKGINKSVSTYIPTSDISKINRGDSTVIVDAYFQEVFQKSQKIFSETNGNFDPTIGILVNAWGFGPEDAIEDLDSVKISELLNFVGFDKVKIENGKVRKKHPEIYFDFNAIAKGYLVDVIGHMFEKYAIKNYMVEIGGEIRARGVNQKGEFWKIAIEKPNFDGTRSFMAAIQLENEAIATSGNYRKYRLTEDGKKYVHTINTKTGYARESNLLSASVISKFGCAEADGYATAFMAMGLKKTKDFIEKHPELKVYLVFENEQGELTSFSSSNFIVEE